MPARSDIVIRMDISREHALRYRWQVQGLDANTGSADLDDLVVLDLGVQDAPHDAARLALVARGVDVAAAVAATSAGGGVLALVWSLRGAPHYYRRDRLPEVAVAVSPFSEKDAANRAAGSGRTLTQGGVSVLEALAALAGDMRRGAAQPSRKGDLSAELAKTLPEHLVTWCRPCDATHPHEQLFRLAALHGGLELEPGTSPPVLHRIPGWPRRKAGPAADPKAAPDQLQVIRGYLHLLGPATPKEVATFLDAPVTDVKEHWPQDAVEVTRAGTKTWMLADDCERLAEAGAAPDEPQVRLLSGFDLFLAAKDRATITADETHHKELWPVLGRPGAIVADGEVLGTWRPKTARGQLTVRVRLWGRVPKAMTLAIEGQADLVAQARGQRLAAVVRE